MNQFARYGALFVAAGLFIGGALEQSNTGAGTIFITAGLISFGCWMTLEIHYLLSDPKHHHPKEEDNE
jgi:hypothetical protein